MSFIKFSTSVGDSPVTMGSGAEQPYPTTVDPVSNFNMKLVAFEMVSYAMVYGMANLRSKRSYDILVIFNGRYLYFIRRKDLPEQVIQAGLPESATLAGQPESFVLAG